MPLSPSIHLPPITADLPVGDVKQRIITEIERTRDYNKYPGPITYTVFTTAEYAKPYNLDDKDGVTIKPGVYPAVYLIGLISLLPGILTGLAINRQSPFLPFLISTLIYKAIGYQIYRQTSAGRRELVIDRQGISVNADRFEWANIIGTFILSSDRTRFIKSDLVLIDRSGEIHRSGAASYSVSDNKIAAIIEYFRNQAAAAG